MDYEILKRLNLDHYNVDLNKSTYFYDETQHKYITNLFLLKDSNIICPYCNSKKIKVRSSKKEIINHASLGDNNITIILHKRVYLCTDCNTLFKEKSPFVKEGRNISLQKDIEILTSLRDKTNTYKSVAQQFNVSTTYVTNLFDRKVDLKRLVLPTVLCIDEVYAKKLTKTKYCCVLYSPQWHKIIDVLDSRLKDNLINYFARISMSEKQNVKYISMDLWETYRQMAKLCLPGVCICADSYHIIVHLINCFTRIRINVMMKFNNTKKQKGSYYWLLKKYFKFLLTDLSNISEVPIRVTRFGMYLTKYQIIDYMLGLSEKLRAAYELKEAYRAFNSTATIENARERLDELIHEFKASKIDEYQEFINILENWHEEIINSFNKINGHRISNGPMERVNKDIKTIFGISYGATNFTRMRNRIMYCINEGSPILANRLEKTNKSVGKPRGKYKK